MPKFVGFAEIVELKYCFSGKMHKIFSGICKDKTRIATLQREVY